MLPAPFTALEQYTFTSLCPLSTSFTFLPLLSLKCSTRALWWHEGSHGLWGAAQIPRGDLEWSLWLSREGGVENDGAGRKAPDSGFGSCYLKLPQFTSQVRTCVDSDQCLFILFLPFPVPHPPSFTKMNGDG